MEKLNYVLNRIESIDRQMMDITQKRLDSLTKPLGSLGRLEDLAKKVAGITSNEKPKIKNKVIFTMAGDHGVVEEGVSAYPQEVTPQMVLNFINGGAGINVLARHIGTKVVVVDMGVAVDITHPEVINKKVGYGTKNIAKGPAMTKEQAIKSIENGIEVVESQKEKIDIIGTGDMGIGNTTPSSAIVATITGEEVEKVTGRGTGIRDEIFDNKVRIIKMALKINEPNPEDAIDVLSKVGGFEIGGITGVILASAKNKIPIVIDGFISGAAALLAYKLKPEVKDYMIASHQSVEQGHKILLEYLGLEPLLNLDMRLGEGTGAALGIGLIEAGVKILNEMATFEEANVSKSNK